MINANAISATMRPLTETLWPATRRHALRILFQHVVDVGARGEPRRHGAEDQTSDHRACEREYQCHRLQRDANTWQIGELLAGDESRAPERQRNRDRSTDERQHQAVGQRLPEQPSLATADGAANRKLPRACRRPRHLQVGQVHTGDEQHEEGEAERIRRHAAHHRVDETEAFDAKPFTLIEIGVLGEDLFAERLHRGVRVIRRDSQA
jgi:hypothetical protein